MDREISKEVRRRMLHKRLLKTIVGLGAAGLVIWLVISLLKTENSSASSTLLEQACP